MKISGSAIYRNDGMKVGRIDGSTVYLTTKIRQSSQDTIESLVGHPLEFVIAPRSVEPIEARMARHELNLWKQKQQ